MPSSNRVLGAACGGALLGAIIFGVLTWLGYNFFFPGGFRAMGEQSYPILVVFAGIGAMIGAATGVAWTFPDSPLRSGRR